MTSVIDMDAQQAQAILDEAAANHSLGRALDHALGLGGRAGLRRLADYQRRIAAAESQLLAEHVQDDGNTKRAERLLDDGKTSKSEQRRKANRAKAIGKNAALAEKMADGELSEEQVDVIAKAASKTDGDAACDDALIDRVAAVPPEQGRAIADDYVADRATADGIQTEHNRQRALRRMSKYESKKSGLATISIEGDSVSIKAMTDAINTRADLLYTIDGDRNVPLANHPRTNDQRRFDAAHQLICGLDTKGKPGSGGGAPSKRYTPRAARPQIVIGLTIDHAIGVDPAAMATQVGLGLIPASVLADHAEHADILAALYNRKGEMLWLARLNRHASNSQRIALILRDRGCVLCGADHSMCDAHHTMPYNAPGKGRTDLDNLVLLCQRCHRRLHDENRTIYQDHERNWRSRPATPDETPSAKPTTERNRIRRE